jgi:hypothetical protein
LFSGQVIIKNNSIPFLLCRCVIGVITISAGVGRHRGIKRFKPGRVKFIIEKMGKDNFKFHPLPN